MSYHRWQSAGRAGILAVSFGLAAALSAWADCPPEWLPGEGIPGVDGEVYAMTTWDPDGPGGQPELLVVGGAFTVAGDVIANNIAAWDGTTWQPLGSGMNDRVLALTVYPGAPGQAGELIAGGYFTTAGGQVSAYWARWGCPYRRGDLNCDGNLDLGDINPFVLALRSPTQYDVDYPDCDFLLADLNCDGSTWFEDINPFVACLSYGDCGCP